MDLFFYLLNGGISFWGIAISGWSILFMIHKKTSVKQVLFTYICMLVVSIYYWSNLMYLRLINKESYYVFAHIFVYLFDAIIIYIYKKKKKDINEQYHRLK